MVRFIVYCFCLSLLGCATLTPSIGTAVPPGEVNKDTIRHCQEHPPTDLDIVINAPTEVGDVLVIPLVFQILKPVPNIDTASIDAAILAQVDLMNEEYKGFFHFETEYYNLIETSYDLDFAIQNDSLIRVLLQELMVEDAFTIFVMPTYTGLLGYTMIFPEAHYAYLQLAPYYDNAIIDFESLMQNKSTIIHEFGHAGSLPHTFEIPDELLVYYGLDNEATILVNHMNYVKNSTELTRQQKGIMWSYLARWRHNLIKAYKLERS